MYVETETPQIANVTDELEVIKLFEEKRWGHSPQCPYCSSSSLSKRRKDYRFKCLRCKRSGSVTVNSALHDTRLPLSLWLKAFTATADSGKVPSAQQLQKDLNISYKSAVRMNHKIETLLHASETQNGYSLNESLVDKLMLNAMKQRRQQVLVQGPVKM